jgi:uncharacterized membrane protein YgcG
MITKPLLTTSIALLLIAPTPAIAATIQNDLTAHPKTEMRYTFPDSFKSQLEEIERKHGIDFYVYAGGYDPKDPSLKISPNINAGANKAEQVATKLIAAGQYSPKTVVIAWLRNETNPVKGSVGVTPSTQLKDVGVSSANLSDPDGLVIPTIKRFMPQDPGGAILAIAQKLDGQIAAAELTQAGIRWFLGGVGVIVGGFGLAALFKFIAGLFKEWQETRAAEQGVREAEIVFARQDLANLQDLLQRRHEYFENLGEDPEIVAAVVIYLANEPEAIADIATYRANISFYASTYKEAANWLDEWSAKFEVEPISATDISNKCTSFISQERTAIAAIKDSIEQLERKYQPFIDAKTIGVEALRSQVPQIPTEPVINPWNGQPATSCWEGLGLEAHYRDMDRVLRNELILPNFQYFQTLIAEIQKTIDDRQTLLQKIDQEATRLREAKAKVQCYELLDRGLLIGEGVYYDRRDLGAYDKVATGIKAARTDLTLVDEAALGRLYQSGQFLEIISQLEHWYRVKREKFDANCTKLQKIVDRPQTRKDEARRLQLAAQQAEINRQAQPQSDRRQSSSSTSSSTTIYVDNSSSYSSSSSYGSSGWSSSDSSSSSSSSSDWGGGGSYDSSSGGGDY